MSWADHDHRGDYADARHEHYDYAGLLHRHYDDERTARGLRQDLSVAGSRLGALEDEMREARRRIGALEAALTRLAAALEVLAGEHEETRRPGMAGEAHAAAAEQLSDAFGRLHGAPDAAGPCPPGCPREDQDDGVAAAAEMTP
jgi:chromosome segregation ATPase